MSKAVAGQSTVWPGVRFTRTKGVPARLSHVMNGIAIDVLIRSFELARCSAENARPVPSNGACACQKKQWDYTPASGKNT